MILNKEVSAEQNNAQGYCCEGEHVEFSAELFDGSAFADRTLLVFESKNLGNPAFSSWGITRGDYNSGLETSATEVRIMNLSGVESAWRWGTPGGNLSVGSQHGERVASIEIQTGQPAYVEGKEGIVDLYSFLGVDNLWVDDKDPVDQTYCEYVDQAHYYGIVASGDCKANDCGEPHQQNDGQVNPTSSGSVGVSILHKSQTTSVKRLHFSDLDTKKGAQS